MVRIGLMESLQIAIDAKSCSYCDGMKNHTQKHCISWSINLKHSNRIC